MTISSTTRKAGPFTGDGLVVVFPFAFKVFAAADLLVVQTAGGVDTTKALTTDYTVALNADQNASPGGSVTMLVSPPVGSTLTLTSQVANTQGTDLTNLGGFFPKTITDALDRATIQIQQLAGNISRVLQLPISSTASGALPPPVANTFLGWDNLAATIINYAGLASAAVSSAMAPVVAAATLVLARAALGATAVGEALFTATNAAAARAALGGGQLLNERVITVTGTYTPTAGTNSIDVEIVGGGGGGGGTAATGAGQVAGGAGGGAGGYARSYLTSGFSGVTVTIGPAGTAGAGVAGGSGGTTSFGALLSATGGIGGQAGSAVATGTVTTTTASNAGGAGTGGNLVNANGAPGGYALYGSSATISGAGGTSHFGGGGTTVVANAGGNAAVSPGAGGSGASSTASTAALAGGPGKAGFAIIREYA